MNRCFLYHLYASGFLHFHTLGWSGLPGSAGTPSPHEVSGLQAVRRFGALQAAWMAASDWVLVDALAPHEALIDFIAVAPEARLRGIGSALVRWAERVAIRAAAGNPQAALVLWVRAPWACACAQCVLDLLCTASPGKVDQMIIESPAIPATASTGATTAIQGAGTM